MGRVDFHLYYRSLLQSQDPNGSSSFSSGAGKEEMAGRGSPVNTSHRSLQRPGKGADDEARVVWLGRSGDCFVAAAPLLSYAPSQTPALRTTSSQPYELSADFQQRQVAVIERKYGGARRAHNAALIIQRAYRQYCLAKKWRQVRSPSRRRIVRALPDHPDSGVMKTSSGTLVRLPPRDIDSAGQLHYASVAPHLKLHRYPVGGQSSDRPAPSAQSNRIQVRVSQQTSAQHYYQTTRVAQPAPPGVRVQVPRPARSSSAERNRGLRVLRHQPASASALPLRSQGAEARLESSSPHSSYQRLLHQQQLLYERRLELAAEDPMGAFPSPRATGEEEDPWTSLLPSSYATALGSPAPNRRLAFLGHQLSLPSQLEPDSPTASTASSDSTPPSSNAGHGERSPRTSRSMGTSGGSAGRLVSGPVRRTSESPITVLRTASQASSASSSSSSRSQGTRCCPGSPNPAAEKERELRRKRQYRIALNFFNKKPSRGMELLVSWGFVEADPTAVAKFLLTRRGLSKQMVGDYLGQLHNPFAQAVLECFVEQTAASGQSLDESLRHFLALFRLPGEAQKIERIIQVFSSHYCAANSGLVSRNFRDPETVFVLAFAIIMLNTDLHSPSLKDDKRMKLEDFVKNLRGIDAGEDVDRDLLKGIYDRVKAAEFRPGSDHLTQVLRVDRSILPAPKKPTLALPHRRLVCYCRLYEVEEPNKKQASSAHQRELFLFNDLLVVTKMLGKTKRSGPVSYSFRQAYSLVGLGVAGFRNQHYPYGLRLTLSSEGRSVHFSARSEEDRARFLEDLKEAAAESEEMEALRIRLELEKQAPRPACLHRAADAQRDSGLPDLDEASGRALRHRALSSSTLELAGSGEPRPSPAPAQAPAERRLSLNSDSGMSSTTSVGSRESSPKTGTEAASQSQAHPPTSGRKSSTPFAALFGLSR